MYCSKTPPREGGGDVCFAPLISGVGKVLVMVMRAEKEWGKKEEVGSSSSSSEDDCRGVAVYYSNSFFISSLCADVSSDLRYYGGPSSHELRKQMQASACF